MKEKTNARSHNAEQEDIFADDEASNANQYLLFHLGNELYGIDITLVTEILEMQDITHVPDMPSFLKGVVSVRGRIIPAMDLRLRFGMDERPYDDRSCMIVVNMVGTAVGIIVDTVSEVHDIPESDIEPPPSISQDSSTRRYVTGIGKIEDQVIIIIDATQLLSNEQIAGVQERIE